MTGAGMLGNPDRGLPEAIALPGATSARPDPMQGFCARRMLRDDLPAVLALENRIYPFPWTPGNFLDSIEAGYECWVFEDAASGELAAYAIMMWMPDEVHLLNLGVAPERQRRGLGRGILERLCVDASRRGARGMLLEVRPSNLPALELYTRSGFQRLGVRRRYYPAPGQQREDALVLFRPFDEQGDPQGAAGEPS